MKRSSLLAGAALTVGLLFLLLAGYLAVERDDAQMSKAVSSPPRADPAAPAATAGDAHPSLIHGRIVTVDGQTYEGRLRWGVDEEAFWGHYFNGVKKENPWAALVPPELLPKERYEIEFFGLGFGHREEPADMSRHFMSRFGDLARIESRVRHVRVILKSGAAFDLDRFSASDFDDGVRVWDRKRGFASLDSLRIRTIEFVPAPAANAAPGQLYGTVRTAHGSFTGFLQWDREQAAAADFLNGAAGQENPGLRFESVRSIVARGEGGLLATLRDGREVPLPRAGQASGRRGVYVDDPRYGRVLVPWNVFEGVAFAGGGSGPAYGAFPPGGPLTGRVITRSGLRMAGRLVFDLDESEFTETLDAPADGVNYTIPFGLIASIALPARQPSEGRVAKLALHSGEKLTLECSGDLGPGNAGLLIFSGGRSDPAYIAWADVAQIELDRPPAFYPPPNL